MSKVRILPPEVISKIAAGEVIERPASVIKELIENALDAQADTIELHLHDAGKTLIHIKDTGAGIAAEDIETIFLRHSTSKISGIDDLFNIHSLGFRGEALYSIAAISDVILRSRTKDQDTGWEIHMRGGEKIDLRPVSMPVGTEIEIRELFFNTPARRKFLKSDIAEMNQILNTFVPYTILYPRCRFLLTHQDKYSIDLPPNASFTQRIAETLNLEANHLLEVRRDFPDQKLQVHMILGDINIVRSRRDMQFLFINQRPVQSKSISFHVNEVYRLLLPAGACPFFTMIIDLPPGELDVNIHPTKREVKIRDEQRLTSLLRHLCENTLLTAGKAKQMEGKISAPASAEKGSAQEGQDTLLSSPARSPTSFNSSSITHAKKILSRSLFNTRPDSATFDNPPGEISDNESPSPPTEQYSFPQASAPTPLAEGMFSKSQENLYHKLAHARYVGSFINKFLFFESEKSLLIIDQHAAQERITFEQLIQQMEKGRIEVQHLLTPYLIKLSPQEILAWEVAQQKLDTIGFASTQFDDQTVAIHTYPVLIKDPMKAVRDLLSGENVARCDHETIARRACRASVMAGDVLNATQAEFQRQQLMKSRDPFTCPHGRPTVIEMTENYLDKQFLRC